MIFRKKLPSAEVIRKKTNDVQYRQIVQEIVDSAKKGKDSVLFLNITESNAQLLQALGYNIDNGCKISWTKLAYCL